ncbi:MAG: type II secretion system protein [Shewanella sp.]|nr:type II secretion system protein [Shewanella sp.]
MNSCSRRCNRTVFNSTFHSNQSGFTLIELVVVIIILGILAVTAGPKFMSFQSEARIANLQALKGTISSANSLVYSRALMDGREGRGATEIASPQVLVLDKPVKLNFGYPLPLWKDALANTIQISVNDVTATSTNSSNNDWAYVEDSNDKSIYFYASELASPKDNVEPSLCYVKYQNNISQRGESVAVTIESRSC